MDESAPIDAGRGALSARAARSSPRPSDPDDLIPEVGETGTQPCRACGASSPATAFACIVCGSALGEPLAYNVLGTAMPAVEITLQPGQGVYAHTGALGWMTDTIQMKTILAGNPWAMLGRVASGMTPLVTEFVAGKEPGVVAFTSRLPGAVLPVDVQPGSAYVLQSGAFLAAQPSVSVAAYFNTNLGSVFFGGEGFILQRLFGAGQAFVQIDGDVVQYELSSGQVLLVEPGRVALFDASVGFSIRRMRGVRNILFGDEGLFLAELRGPGHVWLQTMPFAQLVASIAAQLPAFGIGGSQRSGGIRLGGADGGAGISLLGGGD